MSLSLYQIQEEFHQMAEFLLSTGGEITPEIEEALQINKEQLQNKAVNYGFVIKQMDAECSIIDSEVERLLANKDRRKKAIEKLKGTLSAAMQQFDVKEIENPGIMKLSLRKSETCEIDNAAKIPLKFVSKKVTETTSIDKVAIKAAIKAGEEVPGAYIQENQNLQIK